MCIHRGFACPPFLLSKQFQNRGMLVVGRIISGLSVGISSAIIPIYQSEVTAPAIRGRIVSLQQWYILALQNPALNFHTLIIGA